MPLYRRYRRWFGHKRVPFAGIMATSGVLHLTVFAVAGLMFKRDVTLVLTFIGLTYSLLTLLASALGDGNRKR